GHSQEFGLPCIWPRQVLGNRWVLSLDRDLSLDSHPLPGGSRTGTEKRRSFRTRIGNHVRRRRRPRPRVRSVRLIPTASRRSIFARGTWRLEIAPEQYKLYPVTALFIQSDSFVDWADVAVSECS